MATQHTPSAWEGGGSEPAALEIDPGSLLPYSLGRRVPLTMLSFVPPRLWIVTVTGLAIVHSAKRLAQKHPNPYSGSVRVPKDRIRFKTEQRQHYTISLSISLEPNSGKLSLGLSKCVALWIVTSRMLPSPPLKLRNLHLPVVDGTEEEAYANREVYDDCDVPLGIVSAHLLSSVETNFAVGDNGGITRSGNAEAEDEDNMPPVLGRGQRKKVPTRRYQGPVFGGALDFFFTSSSGFGDYIDRTAAAARIHNYWPHTVMIRPVSCLNDRAPSRAPLPLEEGRARAEYWSAWSCSCPPIFKLEIGIAPLSCPLYFRNSISVDPLLFHVFSSMTVVKHLADRERHHFLGTEAIKFSLRKKWP
ncbi:hypothetical protein C8R45DRAFT_933820 [Mycena sanguinolenta]|nr:hypothetical protein C8R45DRAFT_933820 [Mycena sanguinolenta]